jgi:hypothetical protein
VNIEDYHADISDAENENDEPDLNYYPDDYEK